MKLKTLKQMVIRFLVIGSIPLGMQLVAMGPESSAQGVDSHIPDLAGIWDGKFSRFERASQSLSRGLGRNNGSKV